MCVLHVVVVVVEQYLYGMKLLCTCVTVKTNGFLAAVKM